MSRYLSYKLRLIAKNVSRELRKNPTESEAILWEYLRNRRFKGYKFRRQHPFIIDLGGNTTFFIADFFCHELSIVIELDGIIHDFQYKKDWERTQLLESMGLSVLRFKNEMINTNIQSVLEEISAFTTIKSFHQLSSKQIE